MAELKAQRHVHAVRRPGRPSTAINAVAELKGPTLGFAGQQVVGPSTAINAVAELKGHRPAATRCKPGPSTAINAVAELKGPAAGAGRRHPGAAIHGYQRRGRIEGDSTDIGPRPTGRPSTAINAVAELKAGREHLVPAQREDHPRLSTPWPN